MAEDFVQLFRADELTSGGVRKAVLADGTAIAVCRIAEELYAFGDMCSHGASSLSEEGELEGFKIVCGWHAGAFDVRTGAAVGAPCTRAIPTYRVEVVGGYVGLWLKDGESR